MCRQVWSPLLSTLSTGAYADHLTRFGETPTRVELFAEFEVLRGQLGVPTQVTLRLGQQRTRLQPPQVRGGNARPSELPLVDDLMRLGEVVGTSAIDEQPDKPPTATANFDPNTPPPLARQPTSQIIPY